MAYKHPPRERRDGIMFCTRHNEAVLCQSCEKDKQDLDRTICNDCKGMIKVWQHQAGHRIVFCDCPVEETLFKCDCGKYVPKDQVDIHPHHFYQPNIQLFLKWGYQAH